MTDKTQQRQQFEVLADKRASKPVVTASLLKTLEVKQTNHPQTVRAS
jgi:hypothetical protein